jgi:predicted Zn-dependent peptidase
MHKRKQLKNGLKIITVPMKGTQIVTVLVMIGVGSRYETEKQAGLSHFIEHMFFKGTKKRPTALHISSELDAIGGEFNAFTSKDSTGYFAKVDAKHIDMALDIVADIYLNSKIEKEEIKKEKGTIIQEINMYEDTPIMGVMNIFENLLYPKNNLGRDIAGSRKTVNSFRREDFLDYLKKFYVSNDTIVAVAGKFDEKEIIKKIKKYFSLMKPGNKAEIIPVKENQKAPEIKIKIKKTDQSHLILGVRTFSYRHKDRFALALLSIILGGNMSSRLFTEVREKRGLAYYVRTNAEAFSDCGYIATQAGVEHKNLELTISTILTEYEKISREKVNAKELQKAKDFIKGKIIMGMESSDEVAMFYLDQELKKERIMTPNELFSRIDKINENDIIRVSENIFRKDRLNLAVIGPKGDKEKLKKLLNLSSLK